MKKRRALIIVDMQVDFTTGALANPEAVKIIPKIIKKIKSKKYDQVIETKDFHLHNYLETLEGKHLPIKHCIAGTDGYNTHPDIFNELTKPYMVHKFKTIEKNTFGWADWKEYFDGEDPESEVPEEIELCGTCTDICVVSNALIIKASYPNVEVFVDKEACAGTTIENHEAALKVMKSCQINII